MAVELVADRLVRIITQDPYRENFFETVSSFRRASVQNIIETDLRATDRQMLRRPLGSPKKSADFDGLMFVAAQLARVPSPFDQEIDMRTTIGPAARIPLTIEIPILVAGMGYGIALSKNARIAIARGANRAGTASNTGEGPVLPEERREAKQLIIQYHRGNWMNLKDLELADAIEIHIGQGSSAAGGGLFPPDRVTKELRRALRLRKDEDAVTLSTFDEIRRGEGLRPLVERARRLGGGVPVLVKLAASHTLEEDLDICVDAGVDGVALDGAFAGTSGSPPITEDDFGIPTVYALVRARRHLDRIDPKRRVSLLVGGGLYTPGDFLKAIALGADAVFVGSIVLFAMMAGQQQVSTPTEPPTEAIMFFGGDKGRFSVEKGALNVSRLLQGCAEEMAYAVRALGKRSVHDVGIDDLCALDETTARLTGAEPAWMPSLKGLSRPPGRGRSSRLGASATRRPANRYEEALRPRA